MMIAERLGDSSKARAAVEQIEIALATMREGGHAPMPPITRRSCREPERCSTASPAADPAAGTHLTPTLSPRKRAERELLGGLPSPPLGGGEGGTRRERDGEGEVADRERRRWSAAPPHPGPLPRKRAERERSGRVLPLRRWAGEREGTRRERDGG